MLLKASRFNQAFTFGGLPQFAVGYVKYLLGLPKNLAKFVYPILSATTSHFPL